MYMYMYAHGMYMYTSYVTIKHIHVYTYTCTKHTHTHPSHITHTPHHTFADVNSETRVVFTKWPDQGKQAVQSEEPAAQLDERVVLSEKPATQSNDSVVQSNEPAVQTEDTAIPSQDHEQSENTALSATYKISVSSNPATESSPSGPGKKITAGEDRPAEEEERKVHVHVHVEEDDESRERELVGKEVIEERKEEKEKEKVPEGEEEKERREKGDEKGAATMAAVSPSKTSGQPAWAESLPAHQPPQRTAPSREPRELSVEDIELSDSQLGLEIAEPQQRPESPDPSESPPQVVVHVLNEGAKLFTTSILYCVACDNYM